MYSFESLAAHHKNHVEFSAWFLFFIMYFIKYQPALRYPRAGCFISHSHTKNQLKTIQKIEHKLACMDYAKTFCL